MGLDLIWPIGLTLLLGYGAVSDIRARRLPNWLALALLITGIAYALVSADGLSDAAMHAAHAGMALLVGMALFALRILGGGDVKFYTGLGAWFPLSQATSLLIWVALLGGVFAVIWLVFRRIRPSKRETEDDLFTKFPYGIAIAAGGMVMAWNGVMAG